MQHRGNTAGIEIAAAEAEEPARLTRRDLGVAQHGIALGDEEIRYRIAVAAGAAQADDMPDVGHRRVALWKQQGAQDLAAIRAAQRRAVGAERHDMGAEPARVMAAAGEIPGAGQTKPTGDRAQLGPADRAPGDDAVRRSEDFLRHLGIEKGGSHRAAVRLFDTPAGAGVMAGDLLDHPNVGHRVELGAAERTRLQQAEEPLVDQRRHDRCRQFAVSLDLVRRRGEKRPERTGSRDVIRAVVQNLAHLSTSCLCLVWQRIQPATCVVRP